LKNANLKSKMHNPHHRGLYVVYRVEEIEKPIDPKDAISGQSWWMSWAKGRSMEKILR
jgi:hypothetical protein